jgi:hypothetical protein
MWTRLNAHYRSAVELARLLLQHTSIDLAQGHTTAHALTIDMARVFEQFVPAPHYGMRSAPPGQNFRITWPRPSRSTPAPPYASNPISRTGQRAAAPSSAT